jgi:hypothetical protein
MATSEGTVDLFFQYKRIMLWHEAQETKYPNMLGEKLRGVYYLKCRLNFNHSLTKLLICGI